MSKNYFSPDEFACKCGCGFNDVSQALVDKLNKARDAAGTPFILTSACRCEIHNELVGGSPNSSHVDGLAADILCRTMLNRHDILGALFFAEFHRIGISKEFIHVDVDTKKTQDVIWVY